MSASNPKPPTAVVLYRWESEEHKQRVLAFANRLRQQGVDVDLDLSYSVPPQGWHDWGVDAIVNSDFVIIVCTEAYKRAFEGKEDAGKGYGVVWEALTIKGRINEHRDDRDGRTAKQKYCMVLFNDATRDDVPNILTPCGRWFVDEMGQFELLLGHLHDIPPAELVELGTYTPLAPIEQGQRQVTFHNLSTRNEFFTGREKELAEIKEHLAGRGMAVLSGLGGTGKTGTAREYAHRHRAEYGHVFWVSADNPTTLLDGFEAIARLVGILPDVRQPDEMDQESAVQHVRLWLAEHDDWLLVLDNADDDADQPHKTDMLRAVKDHLPGAHRGHVLVTTRRTSIQNLGVVDAVEIDDLKLVEAVEFLQQRTRRHELSAEEHLAASDLAEAVGCLPLALEQAAAYVYEKKVPFALYLDGFRRNLASQRKYLLEQSPVMGERQAHDGEGDGRPLATTWEMNFAQLEPAAADLLRLLAFLHPEGIPLELITVGGPKFSQTLADALDNDDPLAVHDELIDPMCRYSLVRYDRDAETLSIHRMVQQVLLANLDEADCRAGAEAAVAAVAAAHPGFGFEHWGVLQRWLPHALVAADWVEQYKVETEAAGLLLNQAGYYLNEQARYAEVEPLLQRSLAIAQQVLGPDHPNVATSLNNLASLYHDQGKYAEAETLYQRSLAIREQVLGPEHPDVGHSLNNLAELYRAQRKYDETEPLYQPH